MIPGKGVALEVPVGNRSELLAIGVDTQLAKAVELV